MVQSSRDRDIPIVTLIKGHTIYKKVPVLTGQCPRCKTLYSADHERFDDTSTAQMKLKRVYLNSPKYMKVGKRLWVDHFSHPFEGTYEVYEFFDLRVTPWYPFQCGI